MQTVKYVVDRIEDGRMLVLASTADESEMCVPMGKFSEKLCENDIVYVTFENGVITSMKVDKTETENRKTEMKKKLNALFDEKI